MATLSFLQSPWLQAIWAKDLIEVAKIKILSVNFLKSTFIYKFYLKSSSEGDRRVVRVELKAHNWDWRHLCHLVGGTGGTGGVWGQ